MCCGHEGSCGHDYFTFAEAQGKARERQLLSTVSFTLPYRTNPTLRYQLREYMHQSVHLMHARRNKEVLQYLSRQMQLEVRRSE